MAPKPIISIIAAIGENRELGKNNKLLWDIPEDLQRFKHLTQGHPIIMGRTTFESIGRPLPGRTNIVITRTKDYKPEGCVVCHSVTDALSQADNIDTDEIFIIGGGKIYQQTIDLADKLYLTLVKASFLADTFFPDYSHFNKQILSEERKSDTYEYIFLELLRG